MRRAVSGCLRSRVLFDYFGHDDCCNDEHQSGRSPVLADKIESRRQHHKELDRLQDAIQKIPRFERFLFTPTPKAKETRKPPSSRCDSMLQH